MGSSSLLSVVPRLDYSAVCGLFSTEREWLVRVSTRLWIQGTHRRLAIWWGVQGWLGGECVHVLLRAIWPSYPNIKNIMPTSTETTSGWSSSSDKGETIRMLTWLNSLCSCLCNILAPFFTYNLGTHPQTSMAFRSQSDHRSYRGLYSLWMVNHTSRRYWSSLLAACHLVWLCLGVANAH